MRRKELYTPAWAFGTGLYMYAAGYNGTKPGIIAALASLSVLAWFLSPTRWERIEEEREARKKRAEYLRCKKNRERNRKNKEKENAKKTA